jgi:hypothetical protein
MHLGQDACRHLLRGVSRQHGHTALRQDGARVVGLVYEVYAGAAEARPRCHDRFVHPAALADTSAGIIHIRWMSTIWLLHWARLPGERESSVRPIQSETVHPQQCTLLVAVLHSLWEPTTAGK